MAEKRHFTAQIIKRNILGNIFVSLFRSVIFMITKGAKVTRSTSAYALPLFLPRPKFGQDWTYVLWDQFHRCIELP